MDITALSFVNCCFSVPLLASSNSKEIVYQCVRNENFTVTRSCLHTAAVIMEEVVPFHVTFTHTNQETFNPYKKEDLSYILVREIYIMCYTYIG